MAKNKDFLWVLIFIAFLIILHISFKEGMEREERRECMQWKKWASEIRRDLFYPSEEMINQCKQYGILIERR